MKYSVYRNLHNGLLSIKDRKTGLVVGHAENVMLVNVKFTVNQKGIERIRKFKRKEVIALATGDIVYAQGFRPYRDRERPMCAHTPITSFESRKLQFNPYRWNTFVDVNEKPVKTVDRLSINNKGVMFASAF